MSVTEGCDSISYLLQLHGPTGDGVLEGAAQLLINRITQAILLMANVSPKILGTPTPYPCSHLGH